MNQLATFSPNVVVTDAKIIQNYYLQKYNKKSTYIPYGSPVEKVDTKDALEQFGVKPGEYILYVSRLEPETNAHLVTKAFESVKTDLKLVVVGDAPYSTEYIQELKSTKDPRIIFTGYVFGSGYREFQSNAYFYVQATEVGGTHPALLEAMGHGNCVLGNDVPEHHEVLANAGVYFNTEEPDNLKNQMQYLLDNPDIVEEKKKLALERVQQNYTWGKVAADYETLFYKMVGGKVRVAQEKSVEQVFEQV